MGVPYYDMLELKQEKEKGDGVKVSRAEVYMETHKTIDGSPVDEVAAENIVSLT